MVDLIGHLKIEKVMKIWSKGFDNAPEIDAFTVGKDRELDLMLAPWDLSLIHI